MVLRQDAVMNVCVVGAGALVLVLSACSGGDGSRGASPTRASEVPVPVLSETVGEVGAVCHPVRRIPEQGGSHLVGGAAPPVPYNSTPPTSGWHSSGAFTVGVQPRNDPLSEPELVSVLEAGGAVISYRAIGDRPTARIERIVRRSYAGQVAVTPYNQLQRGEVALTFWGTVQRCDGVDAHAIRRFVEQRVVREVDQPGH